MATGHASVRRCAPHPAFMIRGMKFVRAIMVRSGDSGLGNRQRDKGDATVVLALEQHANPIRGQLDRHAVREEPLDDRNEAWPRAATIGAEPCAARQTFRRTGRSGANKPWTIRRLERDQSTHAGGIREIRRGLQACPALPAVCRDGDPALRRSTEVTRDKDHGTVGTLRKLHLIGMAAVATLVTGASRFTLAETSRGWLQLRPPSSECIRSVRQVVAGSLPGFTHASPQPVGYDWNISSTRPSCTPRVTWTAHGLLSERPGRSSTVRIGSQVAPPSSLRRSTMSLAPLSEAESRPSAKTRSAPSTRRMIDGIR